MKQILELREEKFIQVIKKIKDCQVNRDGREHDLREKFGDEKDGEDRYETDKLLSLWITIENHLENFLNDLGYEFNHQADRFVYKKAEGANW